MARKVKNTNNPELDGPAFFAAIAQIEQEKGIKSGYMMEKITQALISAYRRDHEGVGDNLTVEADPHACTVRMFLKKDIVEQVDNPGMEISLAEARRAIPHAQLGDVVRIEIKPKSLGSVALRLGSGPESTDAYLGTNEQVKGETYREGQRLKVYVVEVRRATKGPQVLISRTHPGLVKRLFELEVPEIYDGTVEVKSIAREAGSRTKLAVWSADPNVDAIGACVGPRHQRIDNVLSELKNEKVDIIKYSEDPAEYIAAALSPADVLSVIPFPDGKSCRVVVPDDQLSLAIGKEGQNARLAAKLTSFKIDIKPASAPPEPIPEPEPDPVPETEEDSAPETETDTELEPEAEAAPAPEAVEETEALEEANETEEE